MGGPHGPGSSWALGRGGPASGRDSVLRPAGGRPHSSAVCHAVINRAPLLPVQNPVPSSLLSDEPWSTPHFSHLRLEDNDAGSHCASRPWARGTRRSFLPEIGEGWARRAFEQKRPLPPAEWMLGGTWSGERERGGLGAPATGPGGEAIRVLTFAD